MSQENVEVVRACLRALKEGGIDAMEEFSHPEITWRAIEGASDDVRKMRGRDAVRRYLQDWFDVFDELTNVPDELIDVGDDQVVAVQLASGRAKQSGVATEIRYAVLYTIREGLILDVREYTDRDHALKAVGLAE